MENWVRPSSRLQHRFTRTTCQSVCLRADPHPRKDRQTLLNKHSSSQGYSTLRVCRPRLPLRLKCNQVRRVVAAAVKMHLSVRRDYVTLVGKRKSDVTPLGGRWLHRLWPGKSLISFRLLTVDCWQNVLTWLQILFFRFNHQYLLRNQLHYTLKFILFLSRHVKIEVRNRKLMRKKMIFPESAYHFWSP